MNILSDTMTDARSCWKRKTKRRGTATSECALVLPLLILFTVGTIETCSALYLKESLTIAAYEGARVGVRRGGTDAMVTSKITEVLDARGVDYDAASVTAFEDASFTTANDMEHCTVRVSVPFTGNTAGLWGYFWGRNAEAVVTMRKEYQNR